jgi:transcriptional regulator with XRE-family HTH domain
MSGSADVPKRGQPADPALASVLRKLRDDRGESQEALAYRSGLSSGALGAIELGRTNPSWATVRALARALDVSIAKLARMVEAEGGE